MIRLTELRELKGQKIVFHCWMCLDTKETFTTTKQDEFHLSQLDMRCCGRCNNHDDICIYDRY